jgi:hypothetical protein
MSRTVILAWVIGVLSIVMIGVGIAGVVDLYRQTERAKIKSYGEAIGIICGGVVGLGVAQLLRLELALILMHAH